jgi:hypothetical protein
LRTACERASRVVRELIAGEIRRDDAAQVGGNLDLRFAQYEAALGAVAR